MGWKEDKDRQDFSSSPPSYDWLVVPGYKNERITLCLKSFNSFPKFMEEVNPYTVQDVPYS